MEIRRSHLLVVLLVSGSVVGATLTTAQRRSSAATPGSSESALAADSPRWEYCAVTKSAYAASNRAGLYWITYFRTSGFDVVDVEDNATSNAALAKAIARLGDEGWEMVGAGAMDANTKRLDALYFKRPKQRP